jgi:hypothetical protein
MEQGLRSKSGTDPAELPDIRHALVTVPFPLLMVAL